MTAPSLGLVSLTADLLIAANLGLDPLVYPAQTPPLTARAVDDLGDVKQYGKPYTLAINDKTLGGTIVASQARDGNATDGIFMSYTGTDTDPLIANNVSMIQFYYITAVTDNTYGSAVAPSIFVDTSVSIRGQKDPIQTTTDPKNPTYYLDYDNTVQAQSPVFADSFTGNVSSK